LGFRLMYRLLHEQIHYPVSPKTHTTTTSFRGNRQVWLSHVNTRRQKFAATMAICLLAPCEDSFSGRGPKRGGRGRGLPRNDLDGVPDSDFQIHSNFDKHEKETTRRNPACRIIPLYIAHSAWKTGLTRKEYLPSFVSSPA
jgi:hypothetical protein